MPSLRQLTTVLLLGRLRKDVFNDARQPKVRHFAFYYASTQPNLYSEVSFLSQRRFPQKFGQGAAQDSKKATSG